MADSQGKKVAILIVFPVHTKYGKSHSVVVLSEKKALFLYKKNINYAYLFFEAEGKAFV